MVARSAVSPTVKNEQPESPKTTLDALDQAASRAEQAARRLKVSSATPFNQLAFEAEYPGWSSSAHRTSSASGSRRVSANGTSTTFNQLAFEAEYPEWSLSAHRSSSASNSQRASANGTSTPFLGSFMSSEKYSTPASTKISPSTQNHTSSSDPHEAVTTETEKLRKMSSKERGYTPSDKRQGLKPKKSGHFARLEAYTRAGLQASKAQPSPPSNWAQHSNPTSRRSTAANSKGQAFRFSNSPSSPGATDPEIIMQNHLRETSQALVSETKVDSISSSFTSEDQAQAQTPWPNYRDVVDSIIRSLNSRYEELYPNLKNCAIRQEVFDEITNGLLPDLLHGSNYPNKRQAKVIRRFAKELWEQKILQHAANPRRSMTKRFKPPKQIAKKANPPAQTFSTHTDDITMMGPGVSSIKPHQARTKPLVNVGFSLESVGLSPEPKVQSEVLLRACSRSTPSHSHDEQMNTTNDAIGNIPMSEETGLSPLGSVLESPSNQLISNEGDIKATTLSKVRLPSTFDGRTIKQESCNGHIQHSIEGENEQLFVPGDKNISGLSLLKISDRATKSRLMRVNTCGDSSRSSSKYQTHTQDYKKSAGECLESSSLDKDSLCESQPEPNQTKITNPQIRDVLLNTKEVLKPTNKIEGPSAVMSESHPILIESDNDRIPALPAPSKVLGRGATFDPPATSSNLVHCSKPKPSKNAPFQKQTPRRLTTPKLISPSKIFKQQDHSSVDPALEQVFGALNLRESQSHRPYEYGVNLVANELDAQGVIKHVDFSIAECRELLRVICDRQGSERCNSVKTHLTCPKSQLSNAVVNLSSTDISDVAHRAPTTSKILALRKEKSIRRFLQSLKRGGGLDVPSVTRVEASRHDPIASINSGTILRRRAFGLHNEYQTNQQVRHTVFEHISLQRSWKGASGDIVAAAWHPNSHTYAVGATATSNPEDLQYNRPNNLLYGDSNLNTLHELPNHRIDRPRPDTIADGPNASEAVYEACDPKVYKTVSAVQFSPEGHRMLTASHDRTVKIWDVPSADGLPFCTKTLVHSARLTQLDISPRFPNTFAVGCQDTGDSIHVYTQSTLQSPYECMRLGSAKAKLKPMHGIYPECLRWGNTSMTENLLLAGFARWGNLPDNDPGRDGELCVWDIETNQRVKKKPSSQSVTTASFHPFLNAFAIGGAPGNRLTHRYTTRTVVRTWDMRSNGCKMEFECPALDMQDLIFHPQNKDIVAVGCTDGTVYIWDARKPDYILHRLQHGLPITDWDHRYGGMSREQGDAGVTLALWGTGRNDLYTGATDGVVKYWDVSRAPEDVLIKDIAQLQAGVSCGSFSPDGAYLLVGDSTGGVHLLASGPGYLTEEERNQGKNAIKYTPAARNDASPSEHETGQGQGQLAAQDLLISEQLIVHPIFGVGQGPAYAGPYAAYAHDVGPPSKARLLKEIEEQQPVSRKDGHVRDNVAAHNIRATIARRRYELSLPRESEKANAESSVDKASKSKKRKRSRRSSDDPISKRAKLSDIIDLTSDKEDDAIPDEVAIKKEDAEDVPTYTVRTVCFEDKDEEGLEEDHWFPYMDLEVFAKLSLNA